MEYLHMVVGVIGVIGLIGVPVSAVLWGIFAKQAARAKVMRRVLLICLLLGIGGNLAYMAMSIDKYSPLDLEALPGITVTSENLQNGEWDAAVKSTADGKNHSPQLSWDAVAGAEYYAVYMLDDDAENWLHWKSVTAETTVKEGQFAATEYVGPYPPSGTHNYTVYVFALREGADGLPGKLDMPGDEAGELARALNDSGNVLACGRLSGRVSA